MGTIRETRKFLGGLKKKAVKVKQTKRFRKEKLPVDARWVSPVTACGYLNKCGGSVRTWKKRWLVLSHRTLYWFESDTSSRALGSVVLEGPHTCSVMRVGATNHVIIKNFYGRDLELQPLTTDASSEVTMATWLNAIQKGIDALAPHSFVGAPTHQTRSTSGFSIEWSDDGAESERSSIESEYGALPAPVSLDGSGSGSSIIRQRRVQAV